VQSRKPVDSFQREYLEKEKRIIEVSLNTQLSSGTKRYGKSAKGKKRRIIYDVQESRMISHSSERIRIN